MNETRKAGGARRRIAMIALMLVLAGCGVDGGDGAVTTAKDTEDQGSGTDGEAAMRAPKSLCERVPHKTVEGATRMDLDPGNPSEADGQQCSWRQPGGAEAVTLRLKEPISVHEHEKAMGFDKGEEIPDLGKHAYSTDLGDVSVLTDEGVFET